MQNTSSGIHPNTSQVDLILEQLYLVQRELEYYFLRAKDLENQLENVTLAEAACSEILSQNQQLLLEISTLKEENGALMVSINSCHSELSSVSQDLQAVSLDRDSAQALCNELKRSLDEILQQKNTVITEEGGHRIESTPQQSDINYVPAGSNMKAMEEDPFTHLMLLKNEVLYFIGNSNVTSSLDSNRVKRLIALLGDEVIKKRVLL
jgi:chromosome segregation ATPase